MIANSPSILSRMTFETATKFLATASKEGLRDDMKSPAARIMFGQYVHHTPVATFAHPTFCTLYTLSRNRELSELSSSYLSQASVARTGMSRGKSDS